MPERLEMDNYSRGSDTGKTVAKAGISFGTALAMVISYTAWHSIFWAIVHGVFGWVYVIYYAIRY